MATKFMRNYLIKCVFESGETLTIGDDNYASSDWTYPNLLTVHFDINRNTFASSNEAHVQIYNLSAGNRQILFHDKFASGTLDFLEVYAGYGQNLSLIFRGRILQAYSYKNGTNMITDIQAIDLAFTQYFKENKTVNYTNRTFNSNTTVKEIIKNVASDTDASIGAIGAIGDKVMQTEISVLNNSIVVIDELTGGHVFVDLGKINVLSDKECLDVGSIPVVDASSGLLGTPMRREVQLEVDTLFEPTIQVGQAIELITPTGVSEYSGIWKVIGIHHTGVISTAVCGTMKTRLNLLTGLLSPQSNLSLVSEEQEVSNVKGEDIEPINKDAKTPMAVIDVYNYIKKNNVAPKWRIGDTRITWAEVIKPENLRHGEKPTKTALANLYNIVVVVSALLIKNFGNVPIYISGGWRDKTNNANVGGVPTSLHLSGNALDITGVGSVPLKKVYNLFVNTPWKNREVLDEGNLVHIGLNKKTGSFIGLWKNKFKRDK